MREWAGGVVACAVLTALPVGAEQWKVIQKEPVLIKTREVSGSGVREIWAEATLEAPVRDIQAAVMDADSYARFMPYVKESRTVGEPEEDGSHWAYTRLDFLAFVTSRDYVVRVWLEEGVREDGSGEFRNRWKADGSRLPERANVVRLKVNEGSWYVVPKGPEQSRAVYRFIVDPGGWVPAFAANMGNKQGVTDTMRAVEKEARRRMKERTGQAAAEVPRKE